MRIVIIDREPEFLSPLVSELEHKRFEVSIVENIPAALAFIKTKSIQFLVADSSVLVDHSLGSEVLRQYPLTRLIVLASHPSLLGMIESIGRGITDYLPREPESFGELVDTIQDERARLSRWQHALLSPLFAKKG
ncbi:MAG: hypothetical protein LBT40_07335 [Deltaproteobacteria bacterium]|jgi:ActR/RegA family two-component response regulator|nr:hypothetical protein [Deltaproteobacteria bacterium]